MTLKESRAITTKLLLVICWTAEFSCVNLFYEMLDCHPWLMKFIFSWLFFHELWWMHFKSLHRIGRKENQIVRYNSVKETCITHTTWSAVFVHVYYSIYVALNICKDFITEFTAKSKASCIDRLLLSIVLHVFGGHN